MNDARAGLTRAEPSGAICYLACISYNGLHIFNEISRAPPAHPSASYVPFVAASENLEAPRPLLENFERHQTAAAI